MKQSGNGTPGKDLAGVDVSDCTCNDCHWTVFIKKSRQKWGCKLVASDKESMKGWRGLGQTVRDIMPLQKEYALFSKAWHPLFFRINSKIYEVQVKIMGVTETLPASGLVSVQSQLLWSVGRVCCVRLSHPLISENEEEVGGSVGFHKGSQRGERLRVWQLVALPTENRDCCYQLFLVGSHSAGRIKEANHICLYHKIATTEHLDCFCLL